MLKIGLLVNPYAGIGGPMAMKGSDGVNIDQLLDAGGSPEPETFPLIGYWIIG